MAVTNDGILKSLQNTAMFKYYPDEDLLTLIESGSIVEFYKQDYLIREGDLSSSFYIIISGSVDVCVSGKDKEVYISTIGEGEVVGEAGIFSKVKRTANVIATEDTLVLELQRDSFIEFIKTHGTSGNQLLLVIVYSLLKKLREVNHDLAFERKDDISQNDIDKLIKDIRS